MATSRGMPNLADSRTWKSRKVYRIPRIHPSRSSGHIMTFRGYLVALARSSRRQFGKHSRKLFSKWNVPTPYVTTYKCVSVCDTANRNLKFCALRQDFEPKKVSWTRKFVYKRKDILNTREIHSLFQVSSYLAVRSKTRAIETRFNLPKISCARNCSQHIMRYNEDDFRGDSKLKLIR